MKMWYDGDWAEVRINQRATVFRCGSGTTMFGEGAALTRFTKQHAVFTTDSGATVKTTVDNIHQVVGKARDERYAVSLKAPEAFTNLIPEVVRFWDSKTCKFVNR